MPFSVDTDLVLRYSNVVQAATGGRSLGDGADPTTKANAAVRSLGRWMSTAVIPLDAANLLNNLFDDVSGPENAQVAGDIEYRCMFVDNVGASTAPGLRLWIPMEISGGASIEIACDPSEITSRTYVGTGSPPTWQTASAQDGAGTLSEDQAPRRYGGTLANYAFSKPLTAAAAISLGNLGSLFCVPVWFRRTILYNTPQISGDGMTLQFVVD